MAKEQLLEDIEFLESLEGLPKDSKIDSAETEDFTDLNLLEKDTLIRQRQSLDFWNNFKPQEESLATNRPEAQEEVEEYGFAVYEPTWDMPEQPLPTLNNTQHEEAEPFVSVRLEENEKDSLLQTLQTYEEDRLSKTFVGGILFCLIFIVFLAILKVYVRNNIYYISRDIIVLQTQIDVLSEENKHIKKQLEDMKFQNLTHEFDF